MMDIDGWLSPEEEMALESLERLDSYSELDYRSGTSLYDDIDSFDEQDETEGELEEEEDWV